MKRQTEIPEVRELIVFLEKASKKNNAPIWADLAERLAKPRRAMASVNVGKIDKNTKEGDTVLVPGKVLSGGSITHAIDIAALRFSMDAERKISSQGSCMDIKSLVQKNPKGTGVIIME
ncbi:MAG: 50S ribosomal protein L18e [Candidatus Micrarchaeota archaeon]